LILESKANGLSHQHIQLFIVESDTERFRNRLNKNRRIIHIPIHGQREQTTVFCF